MELYKRIKLRREELGLSQDELASKLGYKSRSTIAKIESGTNDIPQSKIKAFADALDTTAGYLMGVGSNSMETSGNLVERTASIMKKLDEQNQQDVHDYAEMKLLKQSKIKVTAFPRRDEIEVDPTIVRAAHLDRKGITEEEMDEVNDFFAYADEYAKNKRNKK